MDPRIVVIGGGTGLSVILKGLKEITSDITAVVTVADDGGGSGVLREDLGMLPPGDIRNCIVSLANMPPLIEKLLRYRFDEGMLKGQSLGNLMIAAMTGISGSFEEAIKNIGDIFAITGKVLPVTTEKIHLCGVLENGSRVVGESMLPMESLKQHSRIEKLCLIPESPDALGDVIDSIKAAQIVVLGPGSLFTSLMPNLLVKGVVEAINTSNAKVVYIENIMTQPGETDGFSASDHISVLLKHFPDLRIDYIVSNSEIVESETADKYKLTESSQIIATQEDRKYFDSIGIKLIESNVVEVVKNYVRHDAKALSQIILDLQQNV